MADQDAPKSNYQDHLSTYTSFIALAKIGAIVTVTILLCLIVLSYGGVFGRISGTLLIVLSLIAGMIGIAGGEKGWIAPTFVMALSALAMLYATA